MQSFTSANISGSNVSFCICFQQNCNQGGYSAAIEKMAAILEKPASEKLEKCQVKRKGPPPIGKRPDRKSFFIFSAIWKLQILRAAHEVSQFLVFLRSSWQNLSKTCDKKCPARQKSLNFKVFTPCPYSDIG